MRSVRSTKRSIFFSQSTPNKGGHRERAMQLIRNAIHEVRAGIDFAADARRRRTVTRSERATSSFSRIFYNISDYQRGNFVESFSRF